MDGEDDLPRGVIDVEHDLLDEGAHEALLGAHVRRGRVPREVQMVGEAEERVTGDSRRRRGVRGGETRLTLAAPREGAIPSRFELRGDETVVRIDGLVATGREGHLIGGLLVLELERAAALVELAKGVGLGHEGSFYRDWLHRKQNLVRDGGPP